MYNPANSNRKLQEVEILGSQTLVDFRDAIYCLSDFMQSRERDHQVEVVNTPSKKMSPSMIYIDHVFYIDTRLQTIPDDYYHNLIETWLTKKRVDRSTFRYETKTMQNVILDDIAIQLQQPYMLLHQDECEHMLLVKDIRLISPIEYKSKADFPRTTRNVKYDRFKCSMCSIYPAT